MSAEPAMPDGIRVTSGVLPDRWNPILSNPTLTVVDFIEVMRASAAVDLCDYYVHLGYDKVTLHQLFYSAPYPLEMNPFKDATLEDVSRYLEGQITATEGPLLVAAATFESYLPEILHNETTPANVRSLLLYKLLFTSGRVHDELLQGVKPTMEKYVALLNARACIDNDEPQLAGFVLLQDEQNAIQEVFKYFIIETKKRAPGVDVATDKFWLSEFKNMVSVAKQFEILRALRRKCRITDETALNVMRANLSKSDHLDDSE